MNEPLLLQQLAERLTSLRTKQNLSQSQLAVASGKDIKEIQSLEAGNYDDVYIIDLVRIARALKLSLCDILTGLGT